MESTEQSAPQFMDFLQCYKIVRIVGMYSEKFDFGSGTYTTHR